MPEMSKEFVEWFAKEGDGLFLISAAAGWEAAWSARGLAAQQVAEADRACACGHRASVHLALAGDCFACHCGRYSPAA
jgi:hypothetical protein